MKMQTIKKYINEYGVPEYLSAFGFQVQWRKESQVKEKQLKDKKEIVKEFVKFLKSWGIEEIYVAGDWGKHMAWSTTNGLGIASAQWKNPHGELYTGRNYNY